MCSSREGIADRETGEKREESFYKKYFFYVQKIFVKYKFYSYARAYGVFPFFVKKVFSTSF